MLAAGVTAAMLWPMAGLAQTQTPDPKSASGTGTSTAPTQQASTLPEVKVVDVAIDPNPNAEVGAPYKARTSADFRYVRPLAEIPQTITVITRQAIDDSGLTDLRNILNAQPGISLGTGENGNMFGDRYIIRGQEARSDVFVDSLRDPGMNVRESFAIEQIEITKGPNSSFAGRGSAGGAINVVTKQATLDEDFGRVNLGLGSADFRRVTLDANRVIGDDFALRVNALYGDTGVPGRAPSERERNGVALSGLYDPGDDTSITVDYYGMWAKDRYPDLGGWLQGTVPDRQPAPNPPVYAQEQDFQRSDSNTVTARIQHRFSDTVALQNVTRYGETRNSYVLTGAGARGNAYNPDGSTYPAVTLSTHTGWQDVDYLANLTTVRWDAMLGDYKHSFIFGGEISDNHVVKGNYANRNLGAFNCRTSATATANNAFCALDAEGNPVNGLNTLMQRQFERNPWNADWRARALAGFAMDTVDFAERWGAFAGVRADYVDLSLSIRANDGKQTDYGYDDTLWNGWGGLTYKLTPDGIVYASIGTATNINGGESDVGTNGGYGGAIIYDGSIAAGKPIRSTNYELGTKWNVLNHKLLLTAAAFQVEKSNIMEGANYDSVGTFNTGKNRVRGVELGLVGNITPQLSGQAGVTFMNSRVTESATPANVGKPLSNFPDRSASVQLRYQFTQPLAAGFLVQYESERCAGQPDTAAGIDAEGNCRQPIPQFTVWNLFATYRFNKDLELRLNVDNVTDADYYLAAYRSGSFLYKGDGRQFTATLTYAF
ncbi:MAG: TonB-dependent siderophore receptor [Burkholderiales bacterium]|nr:TonB-dependent siderophore receptor [Burkholderiales bacterium]